MPGFNASGTSSFLCFVERRVRPAGVVAMPRGINQSLVPRVVSEPGREIVPVVTSERARELAVRTLELRLVLL